MSSDHVPTLSPLLGNPASAPLEASAASLFAGYVPPLANLSPPFADSSDSAPPPVNSRQLSLMMAEMHLLESISLDNRQRDSTILDEA